MSKNNVEMTPVVDPYAKLPPDVREKTIGIQDGEDRVSMVERIRDAVTSIVDYHKLLRECAVEGAFHPGKLASALQPHLPANWEEALRDDVDKTPEEQLATIVVGIPRAIVGAEARRLTDEYGLTKEEETRAIKKAIRSKAMGEIGKKIPLKVAKASQANYRDRILAGLHAILNEK